MQSTNLRSTHFYSGNNNSIISSETNGKTHTQLPLNGILLKYDNYCRRRKTRRKQLQLPLFNPGMNKIRRYLTHTSTLKSSRKGILIIDKKDKREIAYKQQTRREKILRNKRWLAMNANKVCVCHVL